MDNTQKTIYVNGNSGDTGNRKFWQLIAGIGLTLASFLAVFENGGSITEKFKLRNHGNASEEQKKEQRIFSDDFYDNLEMRLNIPAKQKIPAEQKNEPRPADEYRISKSGIELIKQFECFREEAYLCPAGVWTIGYGHTKDVCEGDRITREKAIEYLRADLNHAENAVRNNVKVPLTQNQYDSLVSFVFNIGVNAFKNSTLLRKLNSGDYTGASEEFQRWNKVTTDGEKKVCNGLIKRREKEKAYFLGCN